MELTQIVSAIESLLFMSGEPLPFTRLGKTLGIPESAVSDAVEALARKYAGDSGSGLMLIVENKRARLATKPENAKHVEALTKSALQENLSKAALEVLAIIAYRSPITRLEIDAIRGVNCSFTLRNLLLRDLIEREGNPEDARGYVYRPAFRFLEVLGLGSIEELPDFAALSQDERLTLVLEGEDASAAASGKREGKEG
jgi:segregation and condensation protein B